MSKSVTKPLNVLHVVSWYPTLEQPLNAIWIKRLIDSMPHGKHTILHLSIQPGKHFKRLHSEAPGMVLEVPFHSWRLIEWVTSLLLLYFLVFKYKPRDFHLLNVHIAYPLLVSSWVRNWIKIPVVIFEHWSAYHNNFGVKQPGRLQRVRDIFKQKYPLITVSKALAQDIVDFSGHHNFKQAVVPNIVRTDLFEYRPKSPVPLTLLMASFWKVPKQPLVILEAFAQFLKHQEQAKLVIVGGGPQWHEITQRAQENDLINSVELLGAMSPDQLAVQMQSAHGFIHISDYETFSVVCAEAICCGTPVIASACGGVPEFINHQNGILLQDHKELGAAMIRFSERHQMVDHQRISIDAHEKFRPTAVGAAYLDVLTEIYATS